MDIQNKNGETALHLCCGKDPVPELVKLLVLKGASPMVKNALGDSAVSLASRFGHHELYMLLSAETQ